MSNRPGLVPFLLGVCLVTAGAWMLSPWAGIIVTGIFFMLVGMGIACDG